jgi:Protein of unknown function (DUF2892)
MEIRMAMKRNVGWHDRATRIVIGVAIIAAILLWQVDPRWLALIGVIPILTAIGGWCPVYEVLDLTTDNPAQRKD